MQVKMGRMEETFDLWARQDKTQEKCSMKKDLLVVPADASIRLSI